VAVSPEPNRKSVKVSGLLREYSHFVETLGRDRGSINDCRPRARVVFSAIAGEDRSVSGLPAAVCPLLR
jgi:hypothetical protein